MKMNDDILQERLREMADQEDERRTEERLNPLSQYSTTQLKKELRRRKKGE